MKPFVTLVPLLVFFLSNAAHAIKVPIPGDDNNLTVLVQLQPQAQVAENGTPDGKSYNTDFFLRRVRLYAFGNVTKRFTYYFLVDSPNFGKNSDFTSRVLVQEAWAGYQPVDDIFIDVGLSLLPFSHNANQGTTTYNTLDGHGSLYLLQATPTGQPLSNITTRNVGVTFRGYLFDKKLWFRAGVYNGVRGVVSATLPTLNPNGVPRLAGRVQYSILGTEAVPYLQGIYFSTTPILTIGFGADWQSRSIIGVNGVTDFLGLAADVFLEYPTLPDQELIFQVDGYRYPNGNGSAAGTSAGAAGTNDTNTEGPAAASTAGAENPACTSSGVPVTNARVTTDSPPTWLSGRQANHR